MKFHKKAWAAAGMALVLGATLGGAGTAFAAGDTSGQGTNWRVPTTPMTNTVEKGGTTYKVITTWANAWSTSGPDYLGISNSAFYGNGANGNANATDVVTASQSTLIGIWASEANESPNAYNWNSFYNLYATATGGTLSDTAASNQVTWDSASGTVTTFKYRPEIIWYCNNINAAKADTYVKLINEGKYVTAGTATAGNDGSLSDDAITIAEDKSEYYIDGDETYDPKRIQPNNANPYSFVNSAYELAGLANEVIEETASNKGLSSGETVNWKNMNSLPRSNRYTESVDECALNIEKVARGSMYYTLKKINDGSVQKKKVAYVAYVPDYSDRSGTQVTDSTHVVVAVYDYTENIGTGPMDGRASWSPLVVDQLSTDNVYAEQAGGTSVKDGTTADPDSDTTYTLYTATADDLADCDIIYSPHNSYTAAQWQSFIETNASTGAKRKAAANIEYIASSPSVTNGSNYTMDKLLYGCFALDCIYPELFPNMENSTYWYDNVYHITDESLVDALTWAFGKASLPSTTSLARIGSTYSRSDAEAKYELGYRYYKSNASKDSTLKRIAANEDLAGSTTHKSGDDSVDNYYGNYVPSEYWESQDHTSSVSDPITASQTIKLGKSSVTIAKGKSATVKVSGAKTALVVSSSSKKVTAKAVGKTKVKITVKSGAKKGSYKVKVYAKKSSSYKKSATKTITVKVK